MLPSQLLHISKPVKEPTTNELISQIISTYYHLQRVTQHTIIFIYFIYFNPRQMNVQMFQDSHLRPVNGTKGVPLTHQKYYKTEEGFQKPQLKTTKFKTYYKYKTLNSQEEANIRQTFRTSKDKRNRTSSKKKQEEFGYRERQLKLRSQLQNSNFGKRVKTSRKYMPQTLLQGQFGQMQANPKIKSQRLISEPYIINEKQRISKIISLKMQQKDTFRKLKQNTNKRSKLEKAQLKISPENFQGYILKHKLNNIVFDFESESHQYRKRIVSKYKKSKINPQKTI